MYNFLHHPHARRWDTSWGPMIHCNVAVGAGGPPMSVEGGGVVVLVRCMSRYITCKASLHVFHARAGGLG